MSLSPKDRIKIPDTTLFQEMEGETVLLSLANESYFGLNESGTQMWNILSEADSLEAGIQQLLEVYEVEEATLREDVLKLVQEWIDHDLVELVSA